MLTPKFIAVYSKIVDHLNLLLRSSAIGPDYLYKVCILNIFIVKSTEKKIAETPGSHVELYTHSVAIGLVFALAAAICNFVYVGKIKGKLLGVVGIFVDWLQLDGNLKHLLLFYLGSLVNESPFFII